jgi:hypothetical protein
MLLVPHTVTAAATVRVTVPLCVTGGLQRGVRVAAAAAFPQPDAGRRGAWCEHRAQMPTQAETGAG